MSSQAVPSGNLIKCLKEGDKVTKFYTSFTYEDNVFESGNFVLVRAAAEGERPSVGIIRAITSDTNNKIMVTKQCFYRPEDAQNKEGKCYKVDDKRELFYSFRYEVILAESILHECVVHFIPSGKPLPLRALHPGFIVQKVYDFVEKKLQSLTDMDFDEKQQKEIDDLVKRTEKRLGDPPNVMVNAPPVNKSFESFKRKRTTNEPTTAIDKLSKAYEGGSMDVSKYHTFLANNKVLTGNAARDKWLEKLLQGLEKYLYSPTDRDKHKEKFPVDTVIPIIAELEMSTYEALGNDVKKYNQKIRQLDFNLQNTEYLVRRLLKKELDPIALLAMTPDELKEGLTADERMTFEPDMPKHMRMVNVPCARCKEKRVGIKDVINAGRRGDRYQLECCECGHEWFSSGEAIASASSSVPE